MAENKKNEIKTEFERDLIRINVNVAIKRQYIALAVVLLVSTLIATVIVPNEEVRKFLLEILFGILQLIWAHRQK
jgi:hypothetical protein